MSSQLCCRVRLNRTVCATGGGWGGGILFRGCTLVICPVFTCMPGDLLWASKVSVGASLVIA